jgi:hypothetical protein
LTVDDRDRPLRYADCPRRPRRRPAAFIVPAEAIWAEAQAYHRLRSAHPLPPTFAEFAREVERQNRDSPRAVTPQEVAEAMIQRWRGLERTARWWERARWRARRTLDLVHR